MGGPHGAGPASGSNGTSAKNAAFEAIAKVLNDYHKTIKTAKIDPAEHAYMAPFYEQLRRFLRDSKAGAMAELALDLLCERARWCKPTSPSDPHSVNGTSIEFAENALLRILVQPCIIAALSTRQGDASVITAVATALLRDEKLPRDKFNIMLKILATKSKELPLELVQLGRVALRDAATDSRSLDKDDRARAVDLVQSLARRDDVPLAPEITLRPRQEEIGKDSSRFRPMVLPFRNTSPRDRDRPKPNLSQVKSSSAASLPTHARDSSTTKSSISAEPVASTSGKHRLKDTWGIFEAEWTCDPGFSDLEKQSDCLIRIASIEDFWDAIEKGDKFPSQRAQLFSLKIPHKRYLGRLGSTGDKILGSGDKITRDDRLTFIDAAKLSSKAHVQKCSKYCIEAIMALLGERWSDDLEKCGNRLLGIEWEITRVCTLTLCFNESLSREAKECIIGHLAKMESGP